ncbi:MAG: hypothetical protein FWD17_09920 [Polyangiaceae bacterium]|nr:hypothetical protein [Polyangiaceae bacterium]
MLGGLGTFGGNNCGRLVPFAIPLAGVAGLADAGDTWHDWMPYSASPGKLTLIDTEPYEDFGLGAVEGSYTVVEEFVAVAQLNAAGSTDEGSSPGCPAPSVPPPAARDPRCPASPPVSSEACDPSPDPLECEYGGDALGRCTTLAVCALQPDGTYHFVIPPEGQGSCANPPACPATYAAAAAVDVGTDAGMALCGPTTLVGCDYPEGTCACAAEGTARTWSCSARAANGNCPATRPLSGNACSSPGQQCYYANPCGGVYEGMPLVCSADGYWEAFDAQYSCPAIVFPTNASLPTDASTP